MIDFQPEHMSQVGHCSENSPSGTKSCAGCGGRICDRFLLHAVDRYWHVGCLKCSRCQTKLGELQSCFSKGGMILCKNDYCRMFAGSCSGCGQGIAPNEMVMKCQGSAYHVKCFSCVLCNNRLMTGDRYGLVNGSLVCEHDYPKVLSGSVSLPRRPLNKVC